VTGKPSLTRLGKSCRPFVSKDARLLARCALSAVPMVHQLVSRVLQY
jgi:hypothetical protein